MKHNLIRNFRFYLSCFLVPLFINLPYSLGQIKKKEISFQDAKKWLSVTYGDICSKGSFVWYAIQDGQGKNRMITLCATDGSWKKSFMGTTARFTNDGRYCIVNTKNDSLLVVSLSWKKLSTYNKVKSYSFFKDGLIMHKSNDDLEVFSDEFVRKTTYSKVKGYKLNSENSQLVLDYALDDKKTKKLEWIDVLSGKSNEILLGKDITVESFDFAKDGKAIWLLATEHSGSKSVWYFIRNGKPIKLIGEDFPELKNSNMLITGVKFCGLGRNLILNLTEKEVDKVDSVPKVTVWSYKDSRLPTVQTSMAKSLALVDIDKHNLHWLAKENQKVIPMCNETLWLVFSDRFDQAETFWRNGMEDDKPFLVRNNGEIEQLPDFDEKYTLQLNFSTKNPYIVYFDTKQNTWVSYNIVSKQKKDISNGYGASWIVMNEKPFKFYRNVEYWFTDEKILISDNFDLWELDLTGKKAPVNLTNGFGNKNSVYFQLVAENYEGKGILLHAFNRRTKEAGYYFIDSKKYKDPTLLSMGKNFDMPTGSILSAFKGIIPKKAKNASKFLVFRSESAGSVNACFTKDFKSFHNLSNHYPERNFNWYTTELHQWTAYDGKLIQGILYKPEDFDPSKKYPVIFWYYEKVSDQLNSIIEPNLSGSTINIPIMVSMGYLVFTPDIHYESGNPGVSAINAVESGALYLSKLKYVDSKRMGLNGQSMGGYETNMIIAKSHQFAAAISTSGMTNLISFYGSLFGAGSTGPSRQEATVLAQVRMGVPPWERPDLYILNSPIFHVENVTTPILMMANRKDGNVPFEQGIELFTALRRLGKAAWLLEYKDGVHGLLKEDDKLDLMTRQIQFFDHYLQDKPAPIWMINSLLKRYNERDYEKSMKIN